VNDQNDEKPESEELLWQAGATIGDDLGAAAVEVGEAELAAFREGRLAPARQEEIEGLLLGSAVLRRRLAQLAEVGRAAPPAAVRERVLAAFDAELGAGRQGRLLAFRPRLKAFAGLLAAALLALALGLHFLGPASLPADLRYELRASGLRAERGEPATAEPLRALPSTRVKLELIPDRSVAEVELAIYRQRASGEARRLRLDKQWITAENGLIRVEAPAAELLGPEPGRGRLLLAIGAASRSWPDLLTENEDPAAALGGDAARLLVLPFEVALEPEDFPPPN
jgi:hypothetical protein